MGSPPRMVHPHDLDSFLAQTNPDTLECRVENHAWNRLSRSVSRSDGQIISMTGCLYCSVVRIRSVDIATCATKTRNQYPAEGRYLVKGMGRLSRESRELLRLRLYEQADA